MDFYINHNKNIENQYDIISDDFDITRVRIWNNVQNFIINNNNVLINKKLLDVGVGNAKNIIFAKKYNYNCIGIDISQKLLNICYKKGIETYKKDVLELNKDDYGTFDSILCIAVIHHLENIDIQKKAILNMINCLNINGKILLSVWSKELYNIFDTDNILYQKNKKDYRNFNIGPNYVEWNSKNKDYKINRFYFIHDYNTFNNMINDINNIIPISYIIKWEKQNWFCEIIKK